MDLIRAAGGIVWSDTGSLARMALVHRARQGDWTLPKGKLEPGEAWQEAALREVSEEAGCAATLGCFAGAKLLLDRPRPKLVLYWHMRVSGTDGLRDRVADDNVDQVAWLPWRAALARLDSALDRRLLQLSIGGEQCQGAVPSHSLADLQQLVVADQPVDQATLARVLGVVAWAAVGPTRRVTAVPELQRSARRTAAISIGQAIAG